MSSFVILSHNGKSRRSIVGRGHAGHDLESCESFTYFVPSHMRSFFWGYHILFCYFFALELMRGHDFWIQFEMCWQIFDLLPLILNNGIVSGKMRS